MILCVDDSPSWSNIVRTVCDDMGHKVDVAVNGAQAVEMACKTFYQLIFMDLTMPHMDGIEAVGYIRKLPMPFGLGRIYALSGNMNDAIRGDCIRAGFDYALEKPFRLPDLQEIIQKYDKEKPAL